MINSQKKEFCYMLGDIHGREGALDVLFKVIDELAILNAERKSQYGMLCYVEMIRYIEKEFNTKAQ